MLTRDADLPRVRQVLEDLGALPPEGEQDAAEPSANLVDGLTRVAVRVPDSRHTAEVVDDLDRRLGLGVATPEHAFVVTYVCMCPASEPVPVLDPALAILVALNILWSGWGLLSASVGGLMDAGVDAGTAARLRQVVSEEAEGALEVHDLRTRHSGRLTFIEFHLVVPGEMRVVEAHAIFDRIEAALRGEMEGMVVTIHVEPEAKAKHHGVAVL